MFLLDILAAFLLKNIEISSIFLLVETSLYLILCMEYIACRSFGEDLISCFAVIIVDIVIMPDI